MKLVAALLRVVRVTVGLAENNVMAAYRRVYDSRHLQADCEELGWLVGGEFNKRHPHIQHETE